jgi:hypothetical protein
MTMGEHPDRPVLDVEAAKFGAMLAGKSLLPEQVATVMRDQVQPVLADAVRLVERGADIDRQLSTESSMVTNYEPDDATRAFRRRAGTPVGSGASTGLAARSGKDALRAATPLATRSTPKPSTRPGSAPRSWRRSSHCGKSATWPRTDRGHGHRRR